MKRYLIEADIESFERQYFDVVIVGSGLAGLYTALNLDGRFSCAVLSKTGKEQCNSFLAQGGIAAAIDADDELNLHIHDTLNAGANLCDEKAVELLVENGVEEIKNLIALGVKFDINLSGGLHITREGGHSKNRIVHCGGDATGKVIVNHLTDIIEQRENIDIKYETFLVDIITLDNKVKGIIIFDGSYKLLISNNIVICSGGIGQVYKYTTNPESATGDGIACAIRAGAQVSNMEFVQFHPTAFYKEDSTSSFFLISEAVRGEGGILLNNKGERFMLGRHPLAELAPRDIVAREIYKEVKESHIPFVYLDITSKSEEFLKERFPTIFGECLKNVIDISKSKIPVCPVQHYFMGGITTDLDGKTNIEGLYSCGEAAYTGVHGANRLASNSTLECLVFGNQCARDINKKKILKSDKEINILTGRNSLKTEDAAFFNECRNKIKDIAHADGGIIRNGKKLKAGIFEIEVMIERLDGTAFSDCSEMEVYNMALVLKEILKAALKREKSVGSHYRE